MLPEPEIHGQGVMSGPVDGELVLAAGRPRLVERVRLFVGWVGAGRALTQTGRVLLADLGELVVLLDTGDLPDQQEARRRITSSAELPELTAVVEWAKACRLVRVNKGRLVPVKKNMALLDRPLSCGRRCWRRSRGLARHCVSPGGGSR